MGQINGTVPMKYNVYNMIILQKAPFLQILWGMQNIHELTFKFIYKFEIYGNFQLSFIKFIGNNGTINIINISV